MLKSIPRPVFYALAVLIVAFPVYDMIRRPLPVACESFDGAVWFAVVPLIVALLLIPLTIITAESHDKQSGLVVSLVSIQTIILAFANIYSRSGVHAGDVLPDHWSDYIYFSATTFTTLGYGDFLPCPGVRLMTSFEALLGLLYGPLLVALSVNKFIDLRRHE